MREEYWKKDKMIAYIDYIACKMLSDGVKDGKFELIETAEALHAIVENVLKEIEPDYVVELKGAETK